MTKQNGSGKKTETKADFIRGLPATMPAKEAVEKAKEAGIKISEEYVYKIRGTDRRGAAGKGTASKALRKGKVAKVGRRLAAAAASVAADVRRRGTSRDAAAEERFVDLALDLGLARAALLIDKLRARVKGLVLS